MSTVIVKENETLDSAIRRWKKKCANQRSPQEKSGSRSQTLLQIRDQNT